MAFFFKKFNSMHSWLPHPYTALSALLIVLSFPPWNIWPFIWICLIPWFHVLTKTKNQKQSFLQGIWLSYFMSIGGFYWISYVLIKFGNLPWSLSIVCLQVFSLLGQPQFFIFSPFFRFIFQKKILNFRLPIVLSCSLIYTGIDWIVPKLFQDTLGHAFYHATRIKQIVDLGGTFSLTFLAFFINFSIWSIYMLHCDPSLTTTKKKHKNSFSLLLIAGSLVLGSWCYGHFRLKKIHALMTESRNGIQIAAIQANIEDLDKLASETGSEKIMHQILDTFISLTNQALERYPHPDIILWPETAYPSTFKNAHSLQESVLDEKLEKYAQSIHTPLYFGGYDFAENKNYNAFFFLSPNGNLQTYHKNILLVFGEYIPGAESFEFIRNAFPQIANFGKGKGPTSLILETKRPTLPKISISPLICYEVLFSNFVIQSAEKGSQILLNITNDSWFGPWGEPQLHLILASFRSIETRLPLLRSTNSGISAWISPDGEIHNATKVKTQAIMNVFIPLLDPIPTIIKYLGDWFGFFSFLLGSFIFGYRKGFHRILVKRIFS